VASRTHIVRDRDDRDRARAAIKDTALWYRGILDRSKARYAELDPVAQALECREEIALQMRMRAALGTCARLHRCIVANVGKLPVYLRGHFE